MLVLTRRSGEAIRVGEDIKITVVEIKGGQVRLGIEAPAAVPIYREEIYEKVREENILSAGASMDIFRKLKGFIVKK